ncbi:unnamed protein product [Colias eurytheme]|nr:unnamed protein product [Colias eurytheme]
MFHHIFAIYILFVLRVYAQDPVANLIQGRVVGIKAFMENSASPIEIYYGIPYAAPPIGRLRFSPPERHTGWKKTYFAHRMPPSCPQLQDGNNDSTENCLCLNIWTSRELAAEGVVVVTVAYRLHILSFFTLKTVEARGNLALLDQYMALLWVRENISAFGGDPTSITLFGHSAGADSVLYHIVSPRSAGLFHRVIIISPRNIWRAIHEEDNVVDIKKLSQTIAESLGCLNNTNDHEMLHCMRTKPIEEIEKIFSNNTWNKLMQPTPDNFLPESVQYLPYSLATALKKLSNIPLDVMLGTTDLEALDLQDSRIKSFSKKSFQQIYNFTMEKVLPDIFNALSLNNPESLRLLNEAVRWEYWSSLLQQGIDKGTLDALEALVTMDTVVNWGVGSFLLAEKIANLVSRTYVFRYSHLSYVDLHGNRLNVTGAMRGTDLIALLGDAMMLQVARRPASNDEKYISSNYRRYIINFVKFGAPSTKDEWRRFTVNEKNVFEICDRNLARCCLKNIQKDVAFWTQYLPRLSNSFVTSKEYSEKVVGDQGESRLRGGIFAMCGVSITLLFLLFASGLLLHRRRSYRPSSIDSQIAY